jgi:esterase
MSYLEQFHHKITGPEDAPRLVFLHGLLGYWANWRGIISAFENDFRILAYDQRGHGRSIKPEHGYAPEDYAADLEKILVELAWKQVHIVGHSLGGRNAACFAAKFPQRINKLVIEDIGPVANPTGLEYFENLFKKVPTPFRDKKSAKEFLYNNFNPVLGAYLYSNIEETIPGQFDWRFSKSAIMESVRAGRAHDRWEEWKKIKASTLLIRGAKSDEISRADYLRLLQENKNFRGVEISESGHWVHFENPKEFTQTVREFLAK